MERKRVKSDGMNLNILKNHKRYKKKVLGVRTCGYKIKSNPGGFKIILI